MNQDTIIIIDLGSIQNSIVARMIRQMGVYSEIQPHDITLNQIKDMSRV